MSTDTRYTAQDGLNWEAYHDATMSFITGRSGHPGAPPPGYKESYMLRHPKAPLPSAFPEVEKAWENRHASGECWSCCATAYNSEAEDDLAAVAVKDTTDVNLSTSAFSALLNHQALMTHSIGEMAKTRFYAQQPRAVGRFTGQHNTKFFARNGGPVAAKGWKRAQMAKGARKVKGNKKGFKGKRARVRFTSVKPETTEVIVVAGPSAAAEVVDNSMDGVQTVAPGDVFMDDYLVKDEEGEGESLFTDGEDASLAA
ncbi:hypothetical protein B0H16DRAFT_1700403 [Mycena metata]|uniref:Uncharacterized protein n=1 Tax=Mycena metata TaxID=1033252 RepID=A0AAD7MIK6_9AGAR|nr:hypothetical protein B0H16DRAFT_1700403 [Mycena metata]